MNNACACNWSAQPPCLFHKLSVLIIKVQNAITNIPSYKFFTIDGKKGEKTRELGLTKEGWSDATFLFDGGDG
jgi:hypothetical protein